MPKKMSSALNRMNQEPVERIDHRPQRQKRRHRVVVRHHGTARVGGQVHVTRFPDRRRIGGIIGRVLHQHLLGDDLPDVEDREHDHRHRQQEEQVHEDDLPRLAARGESGASVRLESPSTLAPIAARCSRLAVPLHAHDVRGLYGYSVEHTARELAERAAADELVYEGLVFETEPPAPGWLPCRQREDAPSGWDSPLRSPDGREPIPTGTTWVRSGRERWWCCQGRN